MEEKKVDYELLANELIDHLCETEGVRETLETLISLGFTRNEAEALHFDECDIEAVCGDE